MLCGDGPEAQEYYATCGMSSNRCGGQVALTGGTMSWGSDASTKVVGEYIAGIAIAVIAVALFLPIPDVWKYAAVLILVLEGLFIIALQLGFARTWKWRIKRWWEGK